MLAKAAHAASAACSSPNNFMTPGDIEMDAIRRMHLTPSRETKQTGRITTALIILGMIGVVAFLALLVAIL
jgi:hypothetical protein